MPDILSFHNSLFFAVLFYYVLFYYCFISLLCYCHFKFIVFYFSVVLSFLGLSNITTTMPATSTTPTIIATAAPVLKVAPEEAYAILLAVRGDRCCSYSARGYVHHIPWQPKDHLFSRVQYRSYPQVKHPLLRSRKVPRPRCTAHPSPSGNQ